MKKFICGFLCGAVLCTAVGALAVNSIYENPYRITVNGVEKQIQGYNIDDYSYFKLRDISDAVGGFSVGFDNETIVLSTDENTPTTTTSTSPASLNLPLGTVPDPIYNQVPIDNGAFIAVVTNDEFELPVIGDKNNEDCIYISYIIDKANEIVGQDKYTELIGNIYDKTTWTVIFDLSKFDGGNILLDYYYQYLSPWLSTLK